jgi:NADH-quinone oxidoreductase subunit F
LVDVLDNLCTGRGKPEDVDLLVNISNNMMGNTICAFADGTAMPMLGMLQKFREEFMDAAIEGLPHGVRHDDSARAMVEGGA